MSATIERPDVQAAERIPAERARERGAAGELLHRELVAARHEQHDRARTERGRHDAGPAPTSTPGPAWARSSPCTTAASAHSC